jgi:hypothetical protein
MIYTLPYTSTGRSAIVPPPPYIYAVDYVAVHVKIDTASSAGLLPPGCKFSSDDAWLYVSEFISYKEGSEDLIAEDPELVTYREGAVALNIELEGKKYLYFPFMWVDKDWALIRGYINGYPKKIAKIEIGKFHPLLPNYDAPRPGMKIGGYVVRGSSLLMKIKVILRERGDKLPVSNFGPTLTIRRFPSTGEGELDVLEYVVVEKGENKTADIWRGDAELVLNSGVNDELNLLHVVKVLDGYFYRSFFKILGTRLAKVMYSKNNT